MLRPRFCLPSSILLIALVVAGVFKTGLAADTGTSISRKPLPAGVIQTRGVIRNRGGIVPLADGSLLLEL